MSDDSLRALERAARESPDDLAALARLETAATRIGQKHPLVEMARRGLLAALARSFDRVAFVTQVTLASHDEQSHVIELKSHGVVVASVALADREPFVFEFSLSPRPVPAVCFTVEASSETPLGAFSYTIEWVTTKDGLRHARSQRFDGSRELLYDRVLLPAGSVAYPNPEPAIFFAEGRPIGNPRRPDGPSALAGFSA